MTAGLERRGRAARANAAARDRGAPGARELLALTPRRAAVAVAALTALAFVLRVVGIGQSLVDDEIFTYDIVTRFGLSDVVSQVRDTSITPPLHYLLAHVAVQVGDPAIWIRVPSLVLGAASVPLLYLLGVRTVGRGAALTGATLLAISPMAVWYGDEARAYATLTFLVVLSTYALVRAVSSEGRSPWGWWLLYALASAAVLYTHYTGIFVLGAQTAWAVWACLARRDRRRLGELAAAAGLVALAYVPWIPAYTDQHGNNGAGILAIDFLHPLNSHTAWENVAKLLVGQPFEPWDDLLGGVGVALLVLGLAALAAGAWGRLREGIGTSLRPRPSGPLLVAVAAAATPLGLLLYGIFDTSLYAPRNLLASLPALCLLLGAALAWVRPPFRTIAAAGLIAAVALASAQGLRAEHRRPPFDLTAEYLDREAGPRDTVLLLQAGFELYGRNPALRSLQLNLDRPHPFLVTGVAADRERYRRTLERAARRPRLFVVVAPVPGVPESILRERLGARFRLLSERTFAGFAPIRVATYAPTRGNGS